MNENRAWLLRAARAAAVGLFAWILYQVLNHYELGWLFWPIAGAVFAFWLWETLRRRHTRRKNIEAWDRWDAAVLDPAARPGAIQEVRQRLAASQRLGPRLRKEQAHLSVVLAELLDASGKPEEAIRVLAKVNLDMLEPGQAAIVRHARVVAYLSAGLLDDAEVAIEARRGASGEPDIDARLDLLGAMIAVERGDLARAATKAADVEDDWKDEDEGLVVEARLVKAAAADAGGQREEALTHLEEISAETLEALVQVGAPRIRALAKAALEAR